MNCVATLMTSHNTDGHPAYLANIANHELCHALMLCDMTTGQERHPTLHLTMHSATHLDDVLPNTQQVEEGIELEQPVWRHLTMNSVTTLMVPHNRSRKASNWIGNMSTNSVPPLGPPFSLAETRTM